MKRILALVILAVLVSANAFAQTSPNGTRTTATFGDQDSNKNYRLIADANGTIWYANGTSIVSPIENIAVGSQSGSYSLTIADSGLNITDCGGNSIANCNGTKTGSGTKYTLPLCTASILGAEFHISSGVRETITITPTSTADTISYSISGTGLSAGVGVKNSGTAQAGDGIQVQCVSPGVWAASDATGTYATAP